MGSWRRGRVGHGVLPVLQSEMLDLDVARGAVSYEPVRFWPSLVGAALQPQAQLRLLWIDTLSAASIEKMTLQVTMMMVFGCLLGVLFLILPAGLVLRRAIGLVIFLLFSWLWIVPLPHPT
jgi:hypothetical protein